MSGEKTAGQQIWESLAETAPQEFGDVSDRVFLTWDELPAARRARMEQAAAAVETEQLRLARQDRDQLRARVLALAARFADASPGDGTGDHVPWSLYAGIRAEVLNSAAAELRKAAGPASPRPGAGKQYTQPEGNGCTPATPS